MGHLLLPHTNTSELRTPLNKGHLVNVPYVHYTICVPYSEISLKPLSKDTPEMRVSLEYGQ